MKKLYLIVMIVIMILFCSCDAFRENDVMMNSDLQAYNKSTVLKKYETLKLPKKYTIELARENGDAVLTPDRKQYNMERVKGFIDNLNNKICDKVRYTCLTDEGDAIIIDLVYDGESIFFIQDSTRDNFGAKEIRQYKVTNIQSEEDGYGIFVDDELIFDIPILDTKEASSNLNYAKLFEEKGITKEMLSTLYNLCFMDSEILELTKEDLEIIFAPGTPLDGAGFDPSKEQIDELNKKGIDESMGAILFNLGYQFEDMITLSKEVIDFIFPNTELIKNLSDKGISKEKIDIMRKEGKSYKDIITEAIN